MVGIFWMYKDTVIGRAVEIQDGDEYAPGVVDSPDNHNDFWDTETDYKRQFPELRFNEYFDIPRGRVLYNREEDMAIVYMDKVLFNEECKQLLRDYFDLNDIDISWRTDPHYTTSADEIDKLLE